MSNKLFDLSQKAFAKANAAVLSNPGEMVRQMAFPLIQQRRVKGALEYVSRDTGLTYSKTRRLFYDLVDDVWSQEKERITAAFKRFAERQENIYRERADKLAAINAEIERLEGQYGMDLDINPQVVGRAMDRTDT